jgi:hypothetical protein
VFLNRLDRDKDGVPDFADGYDISFALLSQNQHGAGKSYDFAPLVVEIPEPVDLSTSRLTFRYPASDPANVTRSGAGTDADPYAFSVADLGTLRIWKENGSVPRRKASVASGGDFVPKDVTIKPSDLGSGRTITLYVEGLSQSSVIGDNQIKVELDPDGNGPATVACDDAVRTTVFKVDVVHPIDIDFVPTKAGRVMISTAQDDKYHTNVKTTKADKPAQDKSTGDATVVVSAYVTPKYPGIDVYFEVIDPDDKSPYEGKTVPTDPDDRDPNDNRDPFKTMKGGTVAEYTTCQTACLSTTNDKTELKVINGTERAVAETTLNMTDRYAGDNYRVRATCRNPNGSPFDTVSGTTAGAPAVCEIIPSSTTLVAWKRAYLERDNMYQKGATITAAFTPDANWHDDTLDVDNAGDFGVGDQITIFTAGGDTRTRSVIAATEYSIDVADLDISLPKYSGVKLTSSNSTYYAPSHLLTETYGEHTDGRDGGCFVEFVHAPSGSGNVPKYTRFPLPPPNASSDPEVMGFALHWFGNYSNSENTFQVVAARRKHTNSLGSTLASENITMIWTERFSGYATAVRGDAMAETLSHEIGHQFELWRAHVDAHSPAGDVDNHEGTDRCVMSYEIVLIDGFAEFCIDCLFNVRDAIHTF